MLLTLTPTLPNPRTLTLTLTLTPTLPLTLTLTQARARVEASRTRASAASAAFTSSPLAATHASTRRPPGGLGFTEEDGASLSPVNVPASAPRSRASTGDSAMPLFLSGGAFRGQTAGYVFKVGSLGLGYYRDDDEAATELDAVEAAALQRRASSLAGRAGSPPRAGPLLRAGSPPRSNSRAASLAGASTVEVLSPMRARLARKEHWRVCPAPSCARVVETRRTDGSARCGGCGACFRWVDAALYTLAF